VEFARDIVEYFNKNYNTKLFKLPEAYIKKNVAVIS
jgi:tryptophanyl-tRNA synthetase